MFFLRLDSKSIATALPVLQADVEEWMGGAGNGVVKVYSKLEEGARPYVDTALVGGKRLWAEGGEKVGQFDFCLDFILGNLPSWKGICLVQCTHQRHFPEGAGRSEMVGERAWRHIEVDVGDIEDKFSHSLGNGMQVSLDDI